MAHIDITRDHKLTPKKARAAAEKAGKQLSQEFGLKYEWDNEVLRFERPGVTGHMELGSDSVRIVVQLGLLLLAFKGRIEQEIKRNLDELFSAKSDTKPAAKPGAKPAAKARAKNS